MNQNDSEREKERNQCRKHTNAYPCLRDISIMTRSITRENVCKQGGKGKRTNQVNWGKGHVEKVRVSSFFVGGVGFRVLGF